MSKVVKKVATVQDIAGIGRCSLTAAIPILSVLGVQPCPLPTAILSCQTEYPNFHFYDFTNEMRGYIDSWTSMNLSFDGIYSGFLGSEDQINIVIELIERYREALIVVDPVMGDNGEKYKTYTIEMCNKVKDLVKHANIVTPNLTECCILTDRKYEDVVDVINEETLFEISREISELGPEKVVITGVIKDDEVITFAYDKERDESFSFSNPYNNKSYSGTGDIFASIICGMLVRGFDFKIAVNKACDFIKNAVYMTSLENADERNGIFFEPLLKDLII